MSEFKKISVIGLGYIGLPTAAMFASRKVEVVGVDINQVVVDKVNRGEIHIFEPELETTVCNAVEDGFLRASTRPEPADAFLIAVPTPFKGTDHRPDLSFIEAAAISIAPFLEAGNLVVLESTSPVGTTELLVKWLSGLRPDLSFPSENPIEPDISVAHCPERVLPGKVMKELIVNDRIIGGMTRLCAERAVRLYKVFVTGECAIAPNTRTAEMVKLSENSFRDVNIAFANELSLVCERFDINPRELIRLANRHPRVNILQPGPGVGGHCLAVDPWFIVSSAPDRARLIRMARSVNDGMPEHVLSLVYSAVTRCCNKRNIDSVTIACLGISYKPDIDDLRESPALEIVFKLAKKYGPNVLVAEPNVERLPANLIGLGVKHVKAEDAVGNADIVLALVAHAAFKTLSRPDEDRDVEVLDFCSIWS